MLATPPAVRAAPDALFTHRLTTHRGKEVDADMIHGPHSVVFDEAEARWNASKGEPAWVMLMTR